MVVRLWSTLRAMNLNVAMYARSTRVGGWRLPLGAVLFALSSKQATDPRSACERPARYATRENTIAGDFRDNAKRNSL